MSEPDPFLEPGGALRGALFARLLRTWAKQPAAVGQNIGPFRVVRELGQGGMGIVYLAERAEGGFEQCVALKLVRGSTQSPAVAELFRRERSLLAALDHPHIARLIDGGETGDGWLWFAMEHVEGLRIDRHVYERRLTLPERLALFLQVCDAVAFAHRRLVVHRDIKPANILVTPDGWVKLLDFGIATLTGAGAAAAHALTPGWASPEQIRGDTVTTASDIFQLGLLLHALVRIDGWQPQESTALEVTRAGMSGDVAAPDTRIAIADADLAAIVARCLATDADARYASVSALRDDVCARLERRPVVARRGGPGYRFGRAVARHPWVTVACAAVVVALASMGAMLAYQRDLARSAAAAEAVQAERARASLGFLSDLIGEAQPAVHQGHVPTVEDLLRKGSQRIANDQRMQPALRAELQATLGAIHIERGEFAQARALLETAVPVLRERRDAPATLARALADLAYTFDYKESGRSLLLLDEAVGLLHDDPAQVELRQRAARYHAAILYGSGRRAEAATALQALVDEDRRMLGDAHAETAMAKMLYGVALGALDRDAEALTWIEDAYRTLASTLGAEHPRTLQAGQTLAVQLFNLERYADDAALLRDFAPRVANVFGERSPRYARTLTWYGAAQSQGGNPAAAIATLKQALEIFDAAPAADDLGSPNTLQTLGEAYERLGQRELALDAYKRMLARAAERPSSVPVDDGKRPLVVARLLLDMQRYAEVQEYIDAARAASKAESDPHRRIVGSTDLAQARLAAAQGNAARAAACARSAEAILAKYDYAHEERAKALALLSGAPASGADIDAAHAACVAPKR